LNGNQYRCVITGECGTITSNAATLHIKKANQTLVFQLLRLPLRSTTPTHSSGYGFFGPAVAYSSSAPLTNNGADYTMTSGMGTGIVKYNQAVMPITILLLKLQ
jgi:hypothetical protein